MKRILSALLIVMILAAATVLPVSAAEKVTVTYDLMYDGKPMRRSLTRARFRMSRTLRAAATKPMSATRIPRLSTGLTFQSRLRRMLLCMSAG